MRGIKNLRTVLVALASLALVTASIPGDARADGTEILGPPSISIANGTDVLLGGVGLFGGKGVLAPGDIVIEVPAGASVEQVIIYWAGRSSVPTVPPATTTLDVDGFTVTGDIIGGPTLFTSPGDFIATYRADITSLGLVGPGLNVIPISGPPFLNDHTNGAGAKS